MQLPQILLDNNIIVVFRNVVAVLVMVHALLAVACNHLLTQHSDRLVSDGTFPSTLFGGSQISDRILGTAAL